jgi:glycolate oxidase
LNRERFDGWFIALNKLSPAVIKKIAAIVGETYCSSSKEDLAAYAFDATARVFLPDCVVFPKSTEEISSILKLAHALEFSVTARGAGSGLTGGSLAVSGGLILVTSRMNRIIGIDPDNLMAIAEPGVVTGHLHKAVEEQGLFYPPDPASSEFSTLGGNVAECAGGPRAVKYGVTRDYILGLEVVVPEGHILRTGVQTVKGVVGYDLTRLFTGSEGTLGIITKIFIRLLPKPEAVRTLTATFSDMETAAETVSEIIRSGIIPRTVEYMDQVSIRCVENYLNIGLPKDAGAILLLEVDGRQDEVDRDLDRLKALCLRKGAVNLISAVTPDEVARLWLARKSINPALFQYAPHKINEDIVVPRSKIPEMVRRIKQLISRFDMIIATYGHAGDGNIHVNIMLDKNNPEQKRKADEIVDILFDDTLALGGTLSGEHGVGITKLPYIGKEVGPREMAFMKGIKNVFDPKGILNPGKIFPE